MTWASGLKLELSRYKAPSLTTMPPPPLPCVIQMLQDNKNKDSVEWVISLKGVWWQLIGIKCSLRPIIWQNWRFKKYQTLSQIGFVQLLASVVISLRPLSSLPKVEDVLTIMIRTLNLDCRFETSCYCGSIVCLLVDKIMRRHYWRHKTKGLNWKSGRLQYQRSSVQNQS